MSRETHHHLPISASPANIAPQGEQIHHAHDHNQPLREAPAGLDKDTLAIWTAIDSLDDEFGPDYVDALLSENLYLSSGNSVPAVLPPFGDLSKMEVPRCWEGLSHGPHYRTILREILLWGGSGLYPLSFETGPLLPCCVTNDDGEFMNESNPDDDESGIAILRLSIARAARERSPEAFRMALEKIGLSGIPRLLGLRTTAGSVTNAIPVNRETLAVAARARIIGATTGRKSKGMNSSNRLLSISARALTKHCSRQPSGWVHNYWGTENIIMNGTDEERNAAAEIVIEKILNSAVWMNVHHAPGGTRVLELRVVTGHGARWHAADAAFRGFLEPHSRELATKKKEERKSRAEKTAGTGVNHEGEGNKNNVNVANEIKEEKKKEEEEPKDPVEMPPLKKKETKPEQSKKTTFITEDNAWIKKDKDIDTNPTGQAENKMDMESK